MSARPSSLTCPLLREDFPDCPQASFLFPLPAYNLLRSWKHILRPDLLECTCLLLLYALYTGSGLEAPKAGIGLPCHPYPRTRGWLSSELGGVPLWPLSCFSTPKGTGELRASLL